MNRNRLVSRRSRFRTGTVTRAGSGPEPWASLTTCIFFKTVLHGTERHHIFNIHFYHFRFIIFDKVQTNDEHILIEHVCVVVVPIYSHGPEFLHNLMLESCTFEQERAKRSYMFVLCMKIIL